ncbi:MAG: lipocalin family protein [Deltaproteobacteria bacterium]|nr:lipocalin family protein [Deltaproteobacteria bacterium]
MAWVDLNRYAGLWYEIARLPTPFQKNCVGVTAEYIPQADGDLTVVNRCRNLTLDGKRREVKGVAWVADPATQAKLKVRFFWPFYGHYWVLALDDDYQWALVGDPSREYLWILSRSPRMAPERYQALVEQARLQGYPVEQILVTPQAPPAPTL